MPLQLGCSVEIAKNNMEELIKSGKRRDEAYAICLKIAKSQASRCGQLRRLAILDGRLFDEK